MYFCIQHFSRELLAKIGEMCVLKDNSVLDWRTGTRLVHWKRVVGLLKNTGQYSFSTSRSHHWQRKLCTPWWTSIMDWMSTNTLKLNPDKMSIILFGGEPARLGGILPGLDKVTLLIKDQIHDLSVLLDPSVFMKKQISPMARHAFLHFQKIAQLWPFLGRKLLTTLAHVLIISQIDYCHAL